MIKVRSKYALKKLGILQLIQIVIWLRPNSYFRRISLYTKIHPLLRTYRLYSYESHVSIFSSSVGSSYSHPDLLLTQHLHHPTHFFRSHRSSTLDFHFLSHYSYIKAIMLYQGNHWTRCAGFMDASWVWLGITDDDSGTSWALPGDNLGMTWALLWQNLARLWHTLAHSGILLHTLSFSSIL